MSTTKSKRLFNKIAVITGAGSGIGRATSIRFATEGASIIVVDKNSETAQETVALINNISESKALAIPCDISNQSEVTAMGKKVFNTFPRIDILINNAGIGTYSLGNVYQVSEQIWDQVMDVNLKGTWLVTKEIVKKMKRQKKDGELRGKIINNASLAGKVPSPPLGVYSISKAAVIAMTQVLAQELGRFKITVNAVCPGFHVTAIYLNDPNLVKQASELWPGKIALGRIGTAEDVANVLYFLASDDSNYMTGQSLNCGGGCHFS